MVFTFRVGWWVNQLRKWSFDHTLLWVFKISAEKKFLEFVDLFCGDRNHFNSVQNLLTKIILSSVKIGSFCGDGNYYLSCEIQTLLFIFEILEIKITIYLVKFQSQNFNSAENPYFLWTEMPDYKILYGSKKFKNKILMPTSSVCSRRERGWLCAW